MTPNQKSAKGVMRAILVGIASGALWYQSPHHHLPLVLCALSAAYIIWKIVQRIFRDEPQAVAAPEAATAPTIKVTSHPMRPKTKPMNGKSPFDLFN